MELHKIFKQSSRVQNWVISKLSEVGFTGLLGHGSMAGMFLFLIPG